MFSATTVAGTVLFSSQFYFMNSVVYKESDADGLKFYNDNKGYNQMDKMKHAYTTYVFSYLAYDYLRRSGVSKNRSIIYGGSFGLALMAQKELFDGIKGGGFSWGDMAANTVGALMVMGQEYFFDEQVVKFKFSFYRSDCSRKTPRLLGDNFLDCYMKDYNSQSFWLTTNLNRIIPTNYIPDWVSLSVGYSSNNIYGKYENPIEYEGIDLSEYERYRQFLLSLDVDWSKIRTNSPILKPILGVMRFIKTPFPTLEYNSKGKFRFYFMPVFNIRF